MGIFKNVRKCLRFVAGARKGVQGCKAWQRRPWLAGMLQHRLVPCTAEFVLNRCRQEGGLLGGEKRKQGKITQILFPHR